MDIRLKIGRSNLRTTVILMTERSLWGLQGQGVTGSDLSATVDCHSNVSLWYNTRMRNCRTNFPSRCCHLTSRVARRAFEGGQTVNRNSRAAMTRDDYCGNLLWQSGLTLWPSMNWHFYFRDIYDWELDNGLRGGLVSDREMALLHRYGIAREYEMNGRQFIHAEWKKGQRMTSGAKIIGL